jgi:hypothetical protein
MTELCNLKGDSINKSITLQTFCLRVQKGNRNYSSVFYY